MAALPEVAPRFDVERFLAQEQSKDLLRFSTAGSVDDGKSTLIGRLLYDSQNVYEDQVRSAAKASVNRSAGPLDFSLLTDGLRAEREQGITIDVAYRYFSTARRKFIIADTPGHEQYTRNMATGASTADLAIILIDARKGVLPQSRRHTYIASLLGIREFVVAVNKMDLVGYDQQVFERIRTEFEAWNSSAARLYFVPISALEGDNVVSRSAQMPWFDGPALLEYLETVQVEQRREQTGFRLPVQRVIRPDQDFRGFAGQIAAGAVRPGDMVCALPSHRRTRVKAISTFDGDLEFAHAGMSVTLTLEDELDLSRGDMLCAADSAPEVGRRFEARLVWMNERPLDRTRQYLLKHTTQLVSARVTVLRHRVDVNTMRPETTETLDLNAIGLVEIETGRPLFFDAYEHSRVTGSFILIDRETNATVGAGMIERGLSHLRPSGPVTDAERHARYGHGPAAIYVGRRPSLATLLERRMFEHGCAVVVAESPAEDVIEALLAAGLIVIVLNDAPTVLLLDDRQAADEIWEQLFRGRETDGVQGEGI